MKLVQPEDEPPLDPSASPSAKATPMKGPKKRADKPWDMSDILKGLVSTLTCGFLCFHGSFTSPPQHLC